MNKIRSKKIILIMITMGFIFLLTGTIFAVKIMDAVPQNIGFKDVSLKDLSKAMCMECHKGSTIDSHHKTPDAVSGNCFACHKVAKPGGKFKVEIERNCPVCHDKSPHHQSKEAENKECRKCHKTPGVSEYSLKVPSYETSIITPTVKSCNNCHGEGKVGDIDVISIKKTHHSIKLKGCESCHENDRKSQNIRNCERCHSVTAIHEVEPHVEKASCKGCHEVNVDTQTPEVEKQTTPKRKSKTKRKRSKK